MFLLVTEFYHLYHDCYTNELYGQILLQFQTSCVLNRAAWVRRALHDGEVDLITKDNNDEVTWFDILLTQANFS